MSDFTAKKVVVVGAARQGLALSRFLVRRGAQVFLTDARPPAELNEAASLAEELGIAVAFGSHPLELLDGANLVCLSGGVSPTIPLVQEAQRRSIPLSNDSQIFLEECPAQVIGITGSAGKTTTTSLVGLMARKHFEMKNLPNRAWVGGNIGTPLIDEVDEMREDDLAVVELSSFQLELMTRSPQVAAILNITPNHLDRHASMAAYTAAKANILRFQHAGDVAVLNRDDAGAWALAEQAKTDILSFGLRQPPAHQSGTYIEGDWIWLQIGRERLKMLPTEWIQLRGSHNLMNVVAACAIAAGATLALPAIQTAVEEFQGVPHRLEFVRRFNGADWYNDSIATAPERTIAAIQAFNQPIILLLGGRDKNLPWEKLADLVRRKVSRVVLFGEAADLIAEAIGPRRPGQFLKSVQKCETLHEAVKIAASQAGEGDVVLLSPGGTSFDAFKDFEERGEAFKNWVNAL